MRQILATFTFLALGACFVSAQQQPAADSDHVIRIGVALPMNVSAFLVSASWGRDQIVRDLKSLHKDKKSRILIESVPLESMKKDDALAEAADKHCDFALLTKIQDPSQSGGVLVGADGVDLSPRSRPGNNDQQKEMSLDFVILRLQHADVLAEGQYIARTNAAGAPPSSDNFTFQDAANQISSRVARELRKPRVTEPD